MINSMTGFGRGVCSADGREITFEIKSVNHRYLDVSYRMPRHVGFIEDTLRTVIAARVARGHLDVYANYRNSREDARNVEIDATLLSEYISSARHANEGLGLRDDITLSTALRLPDVTSIVESEEDRPAVCELAKHAIELALDELAVMRAQEGERLQKDMTARAEALLGLTESIAARAPAVVEEYGVKLNERIKKLLGAAEVDEGRLATEVAIFADKASIDEEIVRLRSHLEQFTLLMQGEEPAGRKLDFIVQEMNREFNTIGSKANDAAITELVIAGKAEVEKIREQVQNIE